MGTQTEDPVTADARPPALLRGPSARWWDLGAICAYAVMAFFVTARLWIDLPGRTLGSNPSDQSLFEWMLAHAAYAVAHLQNPLFSTRLNMPDGVNLMANTSVLGIGIPLAPVTWLFGPHVTFVLLLVVGFTAGATCWYLLFSRRLVRSRSAAFVGAAFCAYAPGMLAQANAHLHMSVNFLVPLIIWQTFRLVDRTSLGSSIRAGAVLGLLITWQAFIGEEVLLLTTLGLGLFTLATVLLRRDLFRLTKPFLIGMGTAAVVAVVLLAYPLWFQFFGPQSYHGLRPDIQQYGADLAAYPAFSRTSLAGSVASAKGLASGPTEENAFFGWPLLIVFVALVFWLRRNKTVLAVAIVTVFAAICSLGPNLTIHGHAVIRGPWVLFQKVPLFDSIVPTRFALLLIPAIAVVLAVAWDRWRTLAAELSRQWHWAIPIVIVAALLPIAPKPLQSTAKPPTPAIIADGELTRLVPADRSALILPPSRSGNPNAQSWAAEAGLGFRITHGYFLGPSGNPAKPWGIFTAPARPTSALLYSVLSTGIPPTVTPAMQSQAVVDLRYWQAAVVVLPKTTHEAALLKATTDLLGFAPKRVGDVWLWDVRTLAG